MHIVKCQTAVFVQVRWVPTTPFCNPINRKSWRGTASKTTTYALHDFCSRKAHLVRYGNQTEQYSLYLYCNCAMQTSLQRHYAKPFELHASVGRKLWRMLCRLRIMGIVKDMMCSYFLVTNLGVTCTRYIRARKMMIKL